MKKIALISALLISAGASANAQIAFSGMDISANTLVQLSSPANAVGYGLNGQAAFSNGVFGVQADFGAETASGSGMPPNIVNYDAGLHVFGSLSDQIKIGGFASYNRFTIFGSYINFNTYGAEIMASFGKLDTEVSFASVTSNPVDVKNILTANAYYQISTTFEANIGWSQYQSIGSPLNIYTIGADYKFSNLPMSVGLSYNTASSGGSAVGGGTIAANVSYSFGPQSDGRKFGKRNFNYLDLVLKAM